MSDSNLAGFEAELRKLRPATPPPAAMARLAGEVSKQANRGALPAATARPRLDWSGLLRFLVSASAVIILLGAWFLNHKDTSLQTAPVRHLASSSHAALRADKVEIDRQLVADFDAVGKLPGGQPVRFRCRQWMEKVSLRDSAKGLVIEQTVPRLQIVPVGFETD